MACDHEGVPDIELASQVEFEDLEFLDEIGRVRVPSREYGAT